MNELGEIRPSQLMFSFGVGAVFDLPHLSVMIMGLDDWDTRYSLELSEERLLAALRRRLGNQVARLLLPPMDNEELSADPTAPPIGVPVVPFPRWLRCPACQIMASLDSGLFQLIQDRYRSDRTRYIHGSCTRAKNPTALPVRFLLACREGHLTDFPWIDFVHAGAARCQNPTLSMYEFGLSSDASDILITCQCGQRRPLGEAFNPNSDRELFHCHGHHPHLRRIAPGGCPEPARPILLGASNSWFPLVMSALSMPGEHEDQAAQQVEIHWARLKKVRSLEVAEFAVSEIPDLAVYAVEKIWQAIQAKNQRDASGLADDETAEDIKVPEWAVLSEANPATQSADFKLTTVAPPQGFESWFEDTVLVERLREVRALFGFTRIESNGDFTDATYISEGRYTPLTRQPPTWLPVSEVRGEGIFLRLQEERIADWETWPAVQDLEREFEISHRNWRRLRRLVPYDDAFPGIRYVLIHSLAHALMRQIALDCGYTAASLRERFYCRRPVDPHGPMTGLLLYTAAADSEGTLGGLVELGKPLSLGRHLQQALESLRICASDPLCSEHAPARDGRGIHAASCHACLFGPETSCERGNRYLDRGVLLPTLSRELTAFFTA